MWPFKAKARDSQEAAYIAEFNCWNRGAYPYDRLLGCKVCITEHAVSGCEMPEHNSFTATAHDASLHLHPELVADTCVYKKGQKVALGKFLVENRGTILSLRELYDIHYPKPKPTADSSASTPEEVGS